MPRTDVTGWSVPLYKDLVKRVEDDFDAAMTRIEPDDHPIVHATLTGTKPVWCKLLGGASYSLHQMAAYVVRQIFIQHSDEDYLPAHGVSRGIPAKDGTLAVRWIRATGVDTASIDAESPLLYLSGDRSISFVTLQDAVISGGQVDIPIKATETGTNGNLDAGTVLYFSNAIVGVNSAATVLNDPTNEDAVDPETPDNYAVRMLDALSNRGAPASPPELRELVLSVPGVDRAWVLRGTPYPGESLVLFTASNAGETGGVPDDDGGVYHLPQAWPADHDFVYVAKADLDDALGRTTQAGDFAGGLLVTASRDPLQRQWIPIGYGGLVEHSETVWRIPLGETPQDDVTLDQGIHVLGIQARTIYETVYEQAEPGTTNQTVRLPADGQDAQITTPRPKLLAMTIGLPNNTAAMRASVLSALHDLVDEAARPNGSFTTWMIRNAISNAQGHVSHTLPLFMGSSGEVTTTASAVELHVLLDEQITFTDM